MLSKASISVMTRVRMLRLTRHYKDPIQDRLMILPRSSISSSWGHRNKALGLAFLLISLIMAISYG